VGGSRRRRGLAALVPVSAAVALVLTPAVAGATPPPSSFTWTGGGGELEPSWSDGTNWGGSAPSGTVGTLDFPSGACPARTVSPFCDSENDVKGLAVDKLEIEGDYYLSREGITLGVGGLSMSTSAEQSRAAVGLPITLDESQSWSITGNSGDANPYGSAQLDLEKPLTGEDALTVDVKNGGILNLDRGDNEVGSLTIVGTGAKTGRSAYENGNVDLAESTLGAPIEPELNGGDGKAVSVTNAGLYAEGKIGPLTSIGADVGVSNARRAPDEPEGTLQAPNATFDSTSELDLYMDEVPVPAPAYTSISKFTSTGTIELGGARLGLVTSERSCASLPPVGQTFTLLSTTGSLTGTFSNAPKGADVTLLSGCEEELNINYKESGSPQTVTGTVVPASLTDSASATSTNPSVAAEAGDGPLTATASGGMGTVTVGQYESDPVGIPAFASSDKYVDVFLSTGSTFTSLSFTDCELNGGAVVYWYESGQWQPVSEETAPSGNPACVTVTINETTTPNLKQLTGTVFGVALPPTSTTPPPATPPSATTFTPSTPASALFMSTSTPPTAFGGVSLDGSTITVQSSGRAAVKLTCTGTGTCGGKLTLTAKTKGKGKKKAKTQTIGTGTFSIVAGSTAAIKLTIGAAGKALLSAAHGHLSATLTILKSSPSPSETQTESVRVAQQKATKTKKGGK
jgi:hypothetical protein